MQFSTPQLLLRRIGAALGSLVLATFVLAGCGSGEQSEDPGVDDAPAQSDAGGASDDGGTSDEGGTSDAGGTSDEGGASDEGGTEEPEADDDAPIEVTPPEQEIDLPNACTYEGAHLVTEDAPADPELPERGGSTVQITLDQVDGDEARLVAEIDGEQRPIEPATVGDRIGVEDWTLSVTSVCEDQVEFDLID